MEHSFFNSYKDVLEFIFQQLPMYQRQGPKALKYDLSNITRFMEELGKPHEGFPSIHIAGTNGKGSTAHYLSAAFQANGYKTGLYTSPHYKDYRERIKLDGQFIDQNYIIQFFNKNYNLIREVKPSYFELSVALAFGYFEYSKVDIAIIEVGLGGRLDSTNIIQPLLSVITNISWDHMQTLGNSLEEIAGEKAGIIKDRTPVLIGDYQDKLVHVFEAHSEEHNAPIYFSRDFKSGLDLKELGASGPFGHKNISYAWAAIELMKMHYPQFNLQNDKTMEGFANVKDLTNYIGRWHQLSEKPLIIVDGAHNLDGWENILKHLQNTPFKQLHIVVGFVYDKSYLDILPLLPQSAIYYFTQADIPRALSSELLKTDAKTFGLRGTHFQSVNDALLEAKANASAEDLILVSGSIFVAGEVL